MSMRVKTMWFRKAGARPPEEVASVIASTIWRVADKAVTGLSRADYDILTPERGFRILGELIAFLTHYADRQLHGRVPEQNRAAMMKSVGKRLAEVMEQNIREVAGDDGFDYQSNFIGMLDRRGDDYATFAFTGGEPDFAALRYLANAIRELMLASDQPWVVDQIMSIEAPEMLETVKRAVNGLLNPEAPKPKRQAPPD
jgi:hypothetical protein